MIGTAFSESIMVELMNLFPDFFTLKLFFLLVFFYLIVLSLCIHFCIHEDFLE